MSTSAKYGTVFLPLAAAGAAALFFAVSMAEAANFSDADVDGDGALSQEEFASAYPAINAAVFVAADGDGDGALSEAEHAAAMDAGLLQDG